MALEIHLYATDKLQTHCKDEHSDATQAIDRMETYLEGAYDRTDKHDGDVVAKDERIYAPVENMGESFTTYRPCDPNHQKSYDGILDWWKEYAPASCNDYDNADYCNMLITAGRNDDGSPWVSGGVTDMDDFAVCVTGILAAEVPASYEEYGIGGKYRAVRTPHHELGHQMMGSVDNSHDKGTIYDNGTSNHYITPMYVQGSENDCGVEVDRQGDKGREMAWSDCCKKEW